MVGVVGSNPIVPTKIQLFRNVDNALRNQESHYNTLTQLRAWAKRCRIVLDEEVRLMPALFFRP